MLIQGDLHALLDLEFLHQQAGRPISQIILIDRQVEQDGGQAESRLLPLLNANLVLEIHCLHYHSYVMVAILSLSQYIQSQIYLSQCF